MLLENPKFLELATKNKSFTPLKSFSDSLLFYFVGSMCLSNDGDILEIGCGGSTYVLYELATKYNRLFTLCDLRESYADMHFPYYSECNVNAIIDYSSTLTNHEIKPIVYTHVDGDKNYNTTSNDLQFCIDNLAPYGIICQDDYGNNKWPSITQAVANFVQQGKLKIIIVGDSSVWLTKPEYYDYWMDTLANDREFNILMAYLGMQESKKILECDPNYLFINTLNYAPMWRDQIVDNYQYIKGLCSSDELRLLRDIHAYKDKAQFLKMPYPGQSEPGIWLN